MRVPYLDSLSLMTILVGRSWSLACWRETDPSVSSTPFSSCRPIFISFSSMKEMYIFCCSWGGEQSWWGSLGTAWTWRQAEESFSRKLRRLKRLPFLTMSLGKRFLQISQKRRCSSYMPPSSGLFCFFILVVTHLVRHSTCTSPVDPRQSHAEISGSSSSSSSDRQNRHCLLSEDLPRSRADCRDSSTMESRLSTSSSLQLCSPWFMPAKFTSSMRNSCLPSCKCCPTFSCSPMGKVRTTQKGSRGLRSSEKCPQAQWTGMVWAGRARTRGSRWSGGKVISTPARRVWPRESLEVGESMQLSSWRRCSRRMRCLCSGWWGWWKKRQMGWAEERARRQTTALNWRASSKSSVLQSKRVPFSVRQEVRCSSRLACLILLIIALPLHPHTHAGQVRQAPHLLIYADYIYFAGGGGGSTGIPNEIVYHRTIASQPAHTVPTHEFIIENLTVDSQHHRLLANANQFLIVYAVQEQGRQLVELYRLQADFKPHYPTLNALCLSGDGTTVMTGGDDATARFYQLGEEGATLVHSYSAHSHPLKAVDCNQQDLYLSCDSHTVAVCNLPRKSIVRRVHQDQLSPQSTLFQAAYFQSQAGSQLLFVHYLLRERTFATREKGTQLHTKEVADDQCCKSAYHREYGTLGVACGRGATTMWDCRAMRSLGTDVGHKEVVLGCTVTRKNCFLSGTSACSYHVQVPRGSLRANWSLLLAVVWTGVVLFLLGSPLGPAEL